MIAMIPRAFTVHARNEAFAKTIPRGCARRRDADAGGLWTAKRLLCKPNAALIDPDAEARVPASIAGLVAGDVEAPEHLRSLVAQASLGGQRTK